MLPRPCKLVLVLHLSNLNRPMRIVSKQAAELLQYLLQFSECLNRFLRLQLTRQNRVSVAFDTFLRVT